MIGLSNVTSAELRDAVAVTAIDTIQNRYSAGLDGGDDVRSLTSVEIAFVPWGPLGDHPPRTSSTPTSGTPAQQALRSLLELAPNVLPIPGTSSFAHLDENLATRQALT